MSARLLALFALTLLALAPALAHADCAMGSLGAWPPGDAPLPLRPLILLDAYGSERPRVQMLRDGGTAALVAEGHRVPLEVEAVHTGYFSVMQAVLVASAPLKPGTRYALVLRDAAGARVKVRARSAQEGDLPAAWTTTTATPAPLKLSDPARVLEQSYVRFGCGPASNMVLSVPAVSGAPRVVEVKLAEAGKDTATYLVRLAGQRLGIGHGMCSGAFDVTGPERRFTATLTVRDAAGRRVKPQRVRFGGVDPDRPQ